MKHPLEHYALAYETSQRTVKRWRAIGEEKGDACPLDEPEEMLAWWSRHMAQRAPRGINAAVVNSRKERPDAASQPEERRAGEAEKEGELPFTAGTAAPKTTEAPAPGEELVIPEGRGLLAELARLEEFAAQMSARALQPGQGKNYLDAVGKIGILTAKLREEGERMGRLLPRDMVEAAIHDFHEPIMAAFRAMYLTMCERLKLIPDPSAEEAWNEECDALCVKLRQEVLQ